MTPDDAEAKLMDFLQWWEGFRWESATVVHLHPTPDRKGMGVKFRAATKAHCVRFSVLQAALDRRAIWFAGGLTEIGRRQLDDWRKGRHARTRKNRQAAAKRAREAKEARKAGEARNEA